MKLILEFTERDMDKHTLLDVMETCLKHGCHIERSSGKIMLVNEK